MDQPATGRAGRAWGVGLIGEIVAWWVVCVGVWLSTLSQVTAEDLELAVPAGALVAAAACAARRAEAARWRFRRTWTAWLLEVPLSVLLGSARVLLNRLLHPRGKGHFDTLRLPSRERRDVAAGRQALAALSISMSPDTYVVDIDPDNHELLVRRLVPAAPKWASVDPRR